MILCSGNRRSSQVPRGEFEGPLTSIKGHCPAKPSPSFLELPSTQWKPSPGLPYTQTARIGKGKRHFSPEHQPQECFGLLECMHNNIQVQTKISQAQLSLLEDIRDTVNALSVQEQQSHESPGQSEQRPRKGSASSPQPLS
uniref:Uncharacterized protein n=1 Tax=Sphaerodactylus townsendi TaxID=933632 RepID=A0ACB8G8A2_9SAUR